MTLSRINQHLPKTSEYIKRVSNSPEAWRREYFVQAIECRITMRNVQLDTMKKHDKDKFDNECHRFISGRFLFQNGI